MQGLSLLFFALFALVIIGMYIALRRSMGKPSVVAGGGVFASITAMTLCLLSGTDVVLVNALLIGVLMGGGFAFAALAAAWYFGRQEMRTIHG